ncbi:MAG: proline--tRNA ligase, partial [Clostridia bacterium]|nr:proline--tRNA ligase [Clostridia bacterium]
SHNFGDGFAKAFDIQYTDKDNTLKYVHQTSWGLSTRTIGAIIMVHGDDNGLVLPPAVAPIQIVIVPIAAHKEGVLERARALKDELSKKYRVKLDDSDKMPGWKFAEYEMKGVPLRIEVGPRDLEQNQCVAVRRDNGEKTVVSLDEIGEKAGELLNTLHDALYEKALAMRENRIYDAVDYDTFKETIATKPGFVRAMWCGDKECELKIKEDTQATSRCMPFEQEELSDVCVCCGKPAKKMVVWGKAY